MALAVVGVQNRSRKPIGQEANRRSGERSGQPRSVGGPAAATGMVARWRERPAARSTPEASGSLIAAAERLFAARGIDGVSLREINREAQQRNTTSLQYHFGDREGLLRAIMAKHGKEVDARRNALLDQYEADRHAGHPGAGVGVRPAARRQAPRSRRRPGVPAHRRRAGQPQQPGDRAERAVDPARPARPRPRATASPAGARLVAPAAAATGRRPAAAPALRGDALRPHRARPAGVRGFAPERPAVHQPPRRPRSCRSS